MKSFVAAAIIFVQGVINIIQSVAFAAIPSLITDFEIMPEPALEFLSSFFWVIFGYLLFIGIVQVITGIAMFNLNSWAWGAGIAFSLLGLFAFPFGSLLALICLVILLTSREEFDERKQERMDSSETPLLIGIVVLIVGVFWILASYGLSGYGVWGLVFIIVGTLLMLLGRVIK